LQILDEPSADVSIPETDYSFGTLIRAQALGDYKALQKKGRRVIRVNLGKDALSGLDQIARLIRALP
jgi:transaldolase/glucose-6-phosphate isomerase